MLIIYKDLHEIGVFDYYLKEIQYKYIIKVNIE